MKRFRNEMEVASLPDSRFKEAMVERIELTHAIYEGLKCDILAECGDFLLLEEGDDPTAVSLFEGREPVDLTDLDARCYEYVELSENGGVVEMYLVTGDGGGPSIFVPLEPWIGSEFLAALISITAVAARETESTDGKPAGEDSNA